MIRPGVTLGGASVRDSSPGDPGRSKCDCVIRPWVKPVLNWANVSSRT